MIRCVQGNIGGGKTYHTIANFLIPWLNDPDIKCIICNITGLDKQRLTALHGGGKNFNIEKLRIITDEQVKGFWRLGEETNTGYIIDEIQNFYGSSNYKENAESREELKKWLTKCRHSGHSMVYICQVPTMVHLDILKLTEEFITCAKLNFIKFMPASKYTYIHRNTYKSDAKQNLVQGIASYKPEVYLCYQSTDNGVKETATKRKGLFPWQPFALLGVLLLAFMAIRWYFFPKPKPQPKTEQEKTQVQIKAQNEEIRNAKCQEKIADGWMSDGKLVYWLRGGNIVGASIDSGLRFGSRGAIDGCSIEVRPTSDADYMARPGNTETGASVGSESNGGSGGSTSVGK